MAEPKLSPVGPANCRETAGAAGKSKGRTVGHPEPKGNHQPRNCANSLRSQSESW